MISKSNNSKSYQQPETDSIYQLLKVKAEKNPDAIAITAPGRSHLSYSRLLGHVENMVDTLRKFGLSRNDRVALVLPNGPEMAVAFLVVAAGATCAPLNPAYRANEFDFYLSDLDARALIVLDEMDTPAREVAQKRNIPIIELISNRTADAGIFELIGNSKGSCSEDGFAQFEDTALVLHTSGTTSRPKIVPLTQTNICSSAHNVSVSLELTETERCLNVMPLFHIHGLIGAVGSSLSAGATVVCTPGLDVERFFEWVDEFQPTWYTAVPTMHQAILAMASANRAIIERRPMRFIRSCSAALPEPIMSELENVFSVPVIESYGMTEASHQMASNPLPPLPRKAGSVGIAAGPDVAIMNEDGDLLSNGKIGEIVIRGINVTKGYENNPKANEEAFTNDWFRTGDQGRFDGDGYLFLTGRLKEIINRGGEKIAPKEVDDILIQHPAINQAVAFAVPHATLGEDVAAAVVLNENAATTESEIIDFVSEQLADFKVPSQILIVEEIPKGATGKLQRIGLADKLASKLQADFVAPKNAIEKKLAKLWSDMLRLDQVGVFDNFFVIGGDSIRAASMISETENRFNKQVPLGLFLKSPTIETLANIILDKPLTRSVSGVSEQRKSSKPIKDTFWGGLRNRLLQLVALYAPGFKTTRVWLHRMRGVSIGNNVSIGLSVLLETAYPSLINMGNNVSIGMRVVVIGHLRDLTEQTRASNEPTIWIEDDVYIGPGAVVLPNVTIGKGAVVSAGSVVSRSVPPLTLVQGNPAKPIAHCGISLGGGVSYEEFLRHLTPIKDQS